MAEQKFGLEAILSAKIDRRSLQKDVIDELTEALDDASTIEPDVNTGALERAMKETMGGGGILDDLTPSTEARRARLMAKKGGALGNAIGGYAGARGAAMGGRTGAAVGRTAASAGSKAMGAISSLGAAVSGGLLLVGLGGVVAMGILKGIQFLAKHSPAMSKVADMLGMAWSLFWRPFGNALASLIFPMAKHLLSFAVDWNKWAKEGGLANAVFQAFKSVMTWFADYFINNINDLLSGNSKEGRNSGARLGTLAGAGIGFALGGPVGGMIGAIAGNLIGQLTGALIGHLNTVDWRALLVEAFGPVGGAVSDAVHSLFPDLSVGEFLMALALPTIAPGILLSHINWPAARDLFEALKARLPSWKAVVPKLPTWSTLKPTLPKWKGLIPDLPDWSDLNPWGKNKNRNGNRNTSTSGGNSGTGALTDGWAVREAQTNNGGVLDTAKDLFDGIATGTRNFIKSVTGGWTPFASGGMVNRPTRAIVGEAGPEAIVPLDRLPRLIGQGFEEAIDRRGGAGGVGGTEALEEKLDALIAAVEASQGDVVVQVDGETIARASQDAGDRFLSRRDVYQ